MDSAKRIEELPVFGELDSPAWGGDFPWVTDELFKREYQGLYASPWGDGLVAYRNEDVFSLQKLKSVAHQTLESSVEAFTPPGSPADKGLSGFMAVNSFSFRPPEHRPFKQLTAERLTPASLGGYRQAFREIAADVLDRAAGLPAVDCVADVAKPIVGRVWEKVVGVSADEAARLMELGDVLALLNELQLTDEHVSKANPAYDEYMAVLTTALRRSYESGDYPVLSALVDAHAAMGELGRPAEPFAPFASTLADGFATLPVLLSTVVWAVAEYELDYPSDAEVDQWATSVLSEVLRIHPPVLATVRQASEAFDYEGVHVPEGTNIWMLWVFANRDPVAFPDPMSFQLERPRRKQVTFGGGAYSCSGLNVVRLVGEELLKAMAHSAASVRVEDQSWSVRTLIHHHEPLRVSISKP